MKPKHYTRLAGLEEYRLEDTPFNPQRHNWRSEAPESIDMEACFNAVEEVVNGNGSELLMEGVLGELRKDQQFSLLEKDDFSIQNHKITLIQSGAQLGIFLIEAEVNIGGMQKKVDLIAGVSRNRKMNFFAQKDHQGISNMRNDEAQSLGLDPYSSAYDKQATFPRHYGDYQSEAGSYLYLAEYCQGFVELNLKFGKSQHSIMGDSTERLICLNGINQMEETLLLDDSQSSAILRQVILHQLRASIRSVMLLNPTFTGGDYMYHPQKDRLMLQCHRDTEEMAGRNAMWTQIRKMIQTRGVSPQTETLAYQILQIITHQDRNLAPFGKSRSDFEYFTYSIADIASVISQMNRQPPMNVIQWQRARQLAVELLRIVSGVEDQELSERVQMSRLAIGRLF